MKIAVLFPGQGAQFVGMGKDLYNHFSSIQQLYSKANHILDWDVKEVCFEDAKGVINQTRYTQVALFTTNYAAWEAFKAKNIPVDAVLGFSLGEYDAIAASEVLSFEETLKLVDKRARYMDECAARNPGGMSAVMNLEVEEIKAICKAASEESGETVTVANDNCPGQVTIAGTKVALDLATEKLKEAGAKRVIALKVSGAFHSELMKEAAEKLSQDAEVLSFHAPQIPIVSNVTADFINEDEVLSNIPAQIVNGVRFRESILNLIEQGVDTFIEVGPKCTLSNLVKKISKEVTVLNVEDLASLENVVTVLGEKEC